MAVTASVATGAAVAAAPAPDNYPTFVDEVALASNPFDETQTWTDLTDRTRTRSWGRGRQSERDAPNTGTSTTVFDNTDRALDPENAASTYWPNVLPMRRIRCRATFDGVTYDLFQNFVDPMLGWQLDTSTAGYSEATATANDGFDVLGTFQFTATDTLPLQTPGDRINAVLDVAGWPTDERDIDTTSQQSPLQAYAAGDLTGQSALDVIQAAAADDNGVFYVDGRGYPVYRGRHRQTDPLYTVSQATFCDGPSLADGRIAYVSLNPSSSKILNQYRVTRNGGVEQVWPTDGTSDSITKYGLRVQEVDTLHTSDAEALNYGQYRVSLDEEPHRRYDEMIVDPGNDHDTWLQCLTRKIGDRITVIQSPPGGGDPDERDMHIEAVSATVGPGMDARFTYRLSPASDLVGWVLGDSIYGLLGITTVLTY